VGIIPSVVFLSGTGPLNEGAVSVDAFFKTEDDFVYAAGDVARVFDPFTGKPRRFEHWVEACRQGKHAALAMIDRHEKFEELPFFWTKQYDLEIQYSGWVRRTRNTVFRGGENQRNFLAGFYERGKLRALAGVEREKEIILLSEIIKSGGSVSPAMFADPDTDLERFL
jgi:3-phenylpropionate/trans-cinnamate dioxygenase ferredoxin reductase subunit